MPSISINLYIISIYFVNKINALIQLLIYFQYQSSLFQALPIIEAVKLPSRLFENNHL